MLTTSAIELFSAWAEAQLAYKGLPGLTAAVVHDGTVVWAQGFGWADVARQIPSTPDTIYRIASITKLFTATAVLQLRDAGKLQLDDPIIRHLPWFTMQNETTDAPVITIRHLLTHTAGLPREAAFPYWTDNQFPTWAQIEATLGQQHKAVPTETRWKYSNLGLSLAGAIVAQVSGQAYELYIQENILRPLGMSSTYIETVDPHHERLAVGYGRRLPGRLEREIMPFTDCQGISAAGNIASTAADLARFAIFHLGHGTVNTRPFMHASTLREMQRIHWLEPGWQAGWGLGFRIMRQGNKTMVGHGGALLGYRTQLQLCPADNTAVIVLTNADDGDPAAWVDKLFQWVVPAVLDTVVPPPPPPPNWAKYVGKYRDLWGDTQILIQNGKLVAIDPSLPDPLLALSTLEPVTEHRFRIETDNGFMLPGEQAIFHLDSAGNVIHLQVGENMRPRIESW